MFSNVCRRPSKGFFLKAEGINVICPWVRGPAARAVVAVGANLDLGGLGRSECGGLPLRLADG